MSVVGFFYFTIEFRYMQACNCMECNFFAADSCMSVGPPRLREWSFFRLVVCAAGGFRFGAFFRIRSKFVEKMGMK